MPTRVFQANKGADHPDYVIALCPPVVRRDAAHALADLGKATAIPKLEDALNQEREGTAYAGILYALYKLGQREHLNTFLELLKQQDEIIRSNVVNSICIEDLTSEDQERVEQALRHLIAHEPNQGIVGDAEVILQNLQSRR